VRYYHGGVAGLHVGDEIQPPCETGASSVHEATSEAYPGRPNPQNRNDRVYVTTHHEVAFMFAYALMSRGDHPPDRGAVYLAGSSYDHAFLSLGRAISLLEVPTEPTVTTAERLCDTRPNQRVHEPSTGLDDQSVSENR